MNRPSSTKVFGVVGAIAGVVLAGYGLTLSMNDRPYGWGVGYVTPPESRVVASLEAHSLLLVSACFLVALAISYVLLRRNRPRI